MTWPRLCKVAISHCCGTVLRPDHEWARRSWWFCQRQKQSNGKGRFIWNGQVRKPMTRNFDSVHPDVGCRAAHHCERIRMENGVTAKLFNEADDVAGLAQPIGNSHQLSSLDWVRDMLRTTFEKPTPFQVQCWPTTLSGHDLISVAETSTGNTLAYPC